MATQPILSDVLPEALAAALIDDGFDQFRTHARYKYLEAFVDRGAASPTRALTRRDVQAYLEATFSDMEFNSRATSNTALRELVEAGFLGCDTQTQTHRYWLIWVGADGSQTVLGDSTAKTAITDGSGGETATRVGDEETTRHADGAVASSDRHQRSDEAVNSSVTTERAGGWKLFGVSLSRPWTAAWVTFFVLFAGGSVAFITVLLLRLAVPSPIVTGSAAVAWGLLSLALATGVVLGVRSLKRLGTADQIH